MSGIGSFPAGVGPAGHAPVQPTPRVPTVQPAALRYEGATSDWVYGSDGRLRRVHPVDQGMALGLLVAQGSLRSSPDTGSTLRSIRYLNPNGLQARIEDAVRKANPIARYLADGSVTILSINYQVLPQRGLYVECYYRNNLLGTEERAHFES